MGLFRLSGCGAPGRFQHLYPYVGLGDAGQDVVGVHAPAAVGDKGVHPDADTVHDK